MTNLAPTLAAEMPIASLTTAAQTAKVDGVDQPKQTLEEWGNSTPAKGKWRYKSSDLPLIHRDAEIWFAQGAELLRPTFAAAGHEIPPAHISIGFTSTGYRFGIKKDTQAMCFSRRLSVDGVNEISVAPVVKTTEGVMDLPTHEPIDAVLDCHHGHGLEFQKIATDVMLVDARNLTLKQTLKSMLDQRKLLADLGRFPRKGLRS